MKITRAVVPSLFTTLNIFCGFLSIISSHEGHIENGAWFILLAALFDSLDGIMARITRSSSQFGVELDSLADVVSFGAAPSFLAYQAYLNVFEQWGILIAALPLVAGAIRLARFNVQLVGFDKDHFNGLPIPVQAMTICTYLLQYHSPENGLSGLSTFFFAPLVILLSLLMVSRIKYDTLPKLNRKQIVAHPWKVVSFGVAVIVVVFSKGMLLFHVVFAYVAFGVIRAIIHWLKSSPEVEKKTELENKYSSIDI